MDIGALSSLLAAQQTATVDVGRALMLAVGQEMTATILEMVDNLVLLDVGDGKQLAATLQTDEQLSAGQTVQLVAIDVQPERVTLRLVAETPPSNGPLSAPELPGAPENGAAVAALVSEGLPLTAEAVQELRQAAAAVGATTPEDLHAVAFLLARDLPLTAALFAVVRQGQAAVGNLPALQAQLRSQAAELLSLLTQAEEQASPDLRALLTQLSSLPAPGSELPDAAALHTFLQTITLTLEAALAHVVDGGGEAQLAPTGEQPEGGQPVGGSLLGQPPAGGVLAGSAADLGGQLPLAGTFGEAAAAAAEFASFEEGGPGAEGGLSQVAGSLWEAEAGVPTGADLSHALGSLAEAEEGSGQPLESLRQGVTAQAAPAGQASEPEVGGDATAQARAANVAGQVRESLVGAQGPTTASAAENAPATAGVPGDSGVPLQAGANQPGSTQARGAEAAQGNGDGEPRVSQPPPQPQHALASRQPEGFGQAEQGELPHVLARRVMPALERALQADAPPSAPVTQAAAQLHQTAERFVQAVQFQQLQTLLQPTAAEPYAVFALPVPHNQGEADLRLYVRDEGGRPRIDPDDLRLVIDLRLSQLKRVTITVHLFHRQLSCQIETESLETARLLEGETPRLQQSLRDLGYAVEPIRCGVGGFNRGAEVSHSTLPLAKLGHLNVTA